MSWRSGVRGSFAYIIAIVSGFLLAYLVVAFVIFPSGVIPQEVTVPNVVGLTETDAEQELRKGGLRAERAETRSHSASPPGTVLEQTPAAGTREQAGTSVALVVSGGQRKALVPNVVGLPMDQGETTLEAAGFTLGEVTQRASDQPSGQIIETTPAAGAEVTIPSAVTVMVSTGPAMITVPDVVGYPATEARRLLEQVGLAVVLTGEDGTPGDPPGQFTGTIIEQRPAATTPVGPGTPITLRVRGTTP